MDLKKIKYINNTGKLPGYQNGLTPPTFDRWDIYEEGWQHAPNIGNTPADIASDTEKYIGYKSPQGMIYKQPSTNGGGGAGKAALSKAGDIAQDAVLAYGGFSNALSGNTKKADEMIADNGWSNVNAGNFTYQQLNGPNAGAEKRELKLRNQQATSAAAGTGAKLGGTIGSIWGPLGTAIGTVGGGLLGGLAGMIGGHKRKVELQKQIAEANTTTGRINQYNYSSGYTDYLTTDYARKNGRYDDQYIFQANKGKDAGTSVYNNPISRAKVWTADGIKTNKPNAKVGYGESIIDNVDNPNKIKGTVVTRGNGGDDQYARVSSNTFIPGNILNPYTGNTIAEDAQPLIPMLKTNKKKQAAKGLQELAAIQKETRNLPGYYGGKDDGERTPWDLYTDTFGDRNHLYPYPMQTFRYTQGPDEIMTQDPWAYGVGAPPKVQHADVGSQYYKRFNQGLIDFNKGPRYNARDMYTMWRMPDDPTSRYNFPGDTGIYKPRTYLDTKDHVGYNHLNPLQSVYVANVTGGINGNPQPRTIERRFSPMPWSTFVPDAYDLDSNNTSRKPWYLARDMYTMARMPDDDFGGFYGDTGIYSGIEKHGPTTRWNPMNPMQTVYAANVNGIYSPDAQNMQINRSKSSVEPTTVGIGSLGDTLPTMPNSDVPTAATPPITTPSGDIVTKDPVTGEPVVVAGAEGSTKGPKGKKSPKDKNGKSYRDPSDIDWSGVGVNALGLLAGYNQYVRGKKGQLRRPDIYSRNPYQRQALATLAGLRESAYPAMKANADAARLADYALRNQGGLSAGQLAKNRVALALGTQAQNASILSNVYGANNKYLSQYAQAAIASGEDDRKARMYADQYGEDQYVASHGARSAIMDRGIQNMLKFLEQGKADSWKYKTYRDIMNRYDQQLTRDQLRTLADYNNSLARIQPTASTQSTTTRVSTPSIATPTYVPQQFGWNPTQWIGTPTINYTPLPPMFIGGRMIG